MAKKEVKEAVVETPAAPEAKTETSNPQLILGKFKDQNALINAYTALEAKQSKAKMPKDPNAKVEEPEPEEVKEPTSLAEKMKQLEETPEEVESEDSPEEEGDQKSTLSDGPLTAADMEYCQAEFAKSGELSDKTIATLEKKGIPSAIVSAYIEGQMAIAKAQALEIQSEIGGPKQYSEMMGWAKDNLPSEDIKTFNDAIESGDVPRIKLAVRALNAAYKDKVGSGPSKQIKGKASSAKAVKPFESKAQMVKAMNDRRYQQDEAFRNDVRRRLEITNTSELS